MYFVHPITDGVPFIPADLLADVADAMAERVKGLEFDYIVGAEAMAIPIGTALSLRTGKPLSVIRKRSYGLPGEVCSEQFTGYSRNVMYINGLKKGDRVVVVDDVISTGGTMKAVLGALDHMGVEVVDIIVVIEKGDLKAAIEEETGHRMASLIRVRMDGDRVVILPDEG